MITLRQIAAEIIRLESGGSQSTDSQLREAYVILMIRQALNKMLPMKVYERLNSEDGDRGVPQLMIASYEVTVVGENPVKSIPLPEFYLNLPYNKGLVAIAPVDDPTNVFIPRLNPTVSRGLPCSDKDPGQYSYWTKGMNVYFDDDMDLAVVLVDLVVAAPDSIGINDSLPIYPEMQADVIIMVRQMIAGTPPQDKKLDGNADIGIKTR